MNSISGWISLGASGNKTELIGTPQGLERGFIYYELGQRGADDPRRVLGLISFYFVLSCMPWFLEGPRVRISFGIVPRCLMLQGIFIILFFNVGTVNATWLVHCKSFFTEIDKVFICFIRSQAGVLEQILITNKVISQITIALKGPRLFILKSLVSFNSFQI